MAISLGIYPIFRQTHIKVWVCELCDKIRDETTSRHAITHYQCNQWCSQVRLIQCGDSTGATPVAEIKGRTPKTPLDSGFRMVFLGGSCSDIFWHLVTCFDSWTFFLSLSFVPRLSFCTGRSWPKGGLGSNVKKTSRQEDSIIPHKFRIRDVPQMLHIFCIFLGSIYQYISSFVSL